MSKVYLIRHAHKESNEVHAELTDEGIEAAYNYGSQLKRKEIRIDLIKSSPINRCLETARQISMGYGRKIRIEESKLLGDPGIFVAVPDKAMQVFNNHRLIDIINNQLRRKSQAGFIPIGEAVEALKVDIENFLNQSKTALYISHDAIISPFCAYLQGIERLKEEDIVNFLDTIVFKMDNKSKLLIEPL